DLALSTVARVRVSGRVLVPSGAQFHQRSMILSITRTDPLAATSFQSRTVPVQPGAAQFQISGIPAGTYLLAIDWADGTRRYSGRQPIDLGLDSVDNVFVTLVPEA